MPASVSFDFPSDVLESARMTLGDAKLELAIALFSRGHLPVGKVAEFQLHMGTRNLVAHYNIQDALEDKATLAQMCRA